MARWCTHPVVAFTQFSATAESLYRALRLQPGIALLSGTSARIASGVVSRSEVLARLLSSDRRHHRAVRLLITTDVLSEGLSLAGVATIVHLDLPWTAARLDQRIGRAARIGAPRCTVRVVTLPARVPADLAARLQTLLASKRKAMSDFAKRTGSDAAHVRLLRHLATECGAPGRARWITVRSTAITHQCVLALVRLRGRSQLLVSEQDRLRAPSFDDWRVLLHATESARGGRGARQRLRTALVGHLAECELREVVQLPGDHRLHARRVLDDHMLARDHARRMSTASGASISRAAVLRPTRAGSGAAFAHSEPSAHAGTSASGTAGRVNGCGTPSGALPERRQRAAVRVRAAVVIVPS